ncbi:GH32 C-terminal domain-containing protein [Pseudarthrobacter sp. CCNWLW207]
MTPCGRLLTIGWMNNCPHGCVHRVDVEGLHPVGGGAPVQLIEATFGPGSAEEFGLVIRGNGSEGTRIGIRTVDGRLAVGRTDRVAAESC